MSAAIEARRQGRTSARPAATTIVRTRCAPPVVDVRDLKVHFPVKQSTRLRHPPRGRPRGRRRLADRSSGARRWASSARAAAASPRSGASVAGLYRPTSGQVLFDGVDIGALSSDELRPLRRRFQIVFQDPYMSLNPRMTVGGLIGEGLAIHKIGKPSERPARVAELMDLVGLRREHVSRAIPHEFSGGQRQRIAIARALAAEPGARSCSTSPCRRSTSPSSPRSCGCWSTCSSGSG